MEKMDLRPPSAAALAVLGDRLGLVDPQDIVGEAAHSGEDAGIFSDARRVFT